MDTSILQYKEIIDPSFAYQLTNGIHRLKKKAVFCDVTIDVAGQKFPCHKVVLASISNYFEAMFTNPMAESKSAEIEMKDMEPLVFETILDFIYSGKCKVSIENAQAVMNAANMLQILALIKICAKYIAENLTVQNCFHIWQFADAIDCRELMQRSMHFSLENFLQVASPLVASLSKVNLIQFISSDSLNIQSEDSVAQIALQWIAAEPERKTDAVEVLSHVRFSLLSSRYLMTLMDNEIMRNNGDIMKLLRQAQLFQSDPTMYFELPYPQASPRHSLKRREYVLLLSTTNDGASFSRQTSQLGNLNWTSGQTKHQGFRDAAICSSAVNSEVFVSGGKDNPERLIMYKAELGLQCEKELATMLTGRQNHTMVIIGGCLHIIGGLERQVYSRSSQQNNGIVSKIEVYNIQQNKWRPAGNLLTGVWQHASVSFQDKVYTFGGTTDISGSLNDATNKVQIYSSQTGECVLGPEIPAAISKCTATVMEESIFIIGLEVEIKPLPNSEEHEEEQDDDEEVYEENRVFYQFKPLDGVWIKLNPPTNVTNSALCTFHGKIWNIVVGSETKVYSYNLLSDVWESNSEDPEDADESNNLPNSVKCMQITY
ncbi:kelch-like protein 24 [Lingula anatina]|uniref:Kelch-like protein 24 n=1 Tax=Lingula anatina TaxID=7574 RepID=A0A1S3H792_LINAN|nr:kelch-like protein 24 [Lingula anatina]|eukprot:XP_013381351.1 kelch-like protein 24 [Lingula anatina]